MAETNKQLARSTGLARRTGLAKRSKRAIARSGQIVPFEGDDSDVIDAVFEEVRRRGRGPGPSVGPIPAEAPVRKALPATDPFADVFDSKYGRSARRAKAGAKVAAKAVDAAEPGIDALIRKGVGASKGVGRFLGPAAVAIAAADIVMRVLDASQGSMDRARLMHGEIGNDVLGNLDVGLEELQTANQGRAIQSIGNVEQGLDIASAMRQPVEEANTLENILTRRRAELAGVGVRAQPGEDEYLLAMRRFM